MILKRIFLCSVDSPNPDEAMAQTRADRPEPAMKLRHLEYFVAAAEELNFTHAQIPPASSPAGNPFANSQRATFHRPKSDVPCLRRLAADNLPTIRVHSTHREGSTWGSKRPGLCRGRLWRRPTQRADLKISGQRRCFQRFVGVQPVRIPLGAVWKKNGLYSGVVSKFVATLSQVCAPTG